MLLGTKEVQPHECLHWWIIDMYAACAAGMYTYSLIGWFAAPLASLVIGRFGCRVCSVAGGILCFVGLSASAFVTSIGQLYITYGLIAGDLFFVNFIDFVF